MSPRANMSRVAAALRRAGSIACLLCIGLSAGAQAKPVDVADVKVTDRGTDEPGAFCQDFDLKPAEAAAFLRQAKVVSAGTIHDRYESLPCYVRGTARWRHDRVEWEIRAGGTGSVTKRDGRTVLLGCAACARRFGRSSK